MSRLPERHLTFLLAVVLLISMAAETVATQPDLALRVWETDEGLPHNGVNAVIQSADGFLWLATQSGLARFDGIAFQKWRSPLLGSARTLAIRSIIQEDPDTLLVANDSSGLLRVRDGQVTLHPLAGQIPPGHRAFRLFREQDGVFWIAFENRELWRCAAGQVERFPARWSGLQSYWPLSFARANDGKVYVGRGRGVETYAEGKLSALTNFPATPTTVAATSDGGLWVATTARLTKFRNGKEITLIEGEPWPADWPPNVMLEDRRGTLWIGTKAQGLCRWEDGKLSSVRVAYPRVESLLEDDEGNLWVGTRGGGLNRIQRARFTLLGESEGVLPDIVGSVCEDSAGDLWFGNRNCVGRLRNGRLEAAPFEESFGRRATSICHDRAGHLWIAIANRLARWKVGSSEPPETIDVNVGTIHALFLSREGHVWVAGEAGPICRFTGEGKTSFGAEEGFTAPGAQALAQAPNGEVWAGSATGELFCLRGDRFQRFGPAEGLPGSAIRAIHVDAAGLVWAGTGGAGLLIGHDGKFSAITELQGLPDDTISQLIEDDEEALWMGSSRGLFKARKRALLDCAEGVAARVVPILFGKADGLAGFSAAANYQPSVFKGRNGQLWFATRKGLVLATPDHDREPQRPPRVFLEGMRADGALLDPARPALPSRARKLEIHFTAPSYTSPETTRFRHRLVGLDSSWSDPSTNRSATYSRLLPGRYTFEVIAGTSDLVWSSAATTMTFEVLPAWWETWWARVFGGLAIVGGVAAVARHGSQRRLKAQLAELENRRRIEVERARIARDLHDSLGAGLTQAGMLAEEMCEDCHELGEMKEHSARLAERVRIIARDLDAAVWAVSPKNDTLASLCSYLCQFALEFFRHSTTRCRVLMAEDIPRAPLSPEMRHHLFLTAREALNNALKHARASEVQVVMRVENGELELAVRDDGSGFSASAADHTERNGLRNMRARMEEIGGHFETQTSAEGTVARLRLPVPGAKNAGTAPAPAGA